MTTLSREAVAEVLDEWVSEKRPFLTGALADAIVALVRPENEVKAEALEEFRDWVDERASDFAKRMGSPYVSGMEYTATLAHRRAHALRSGGVS